MAKPGILLEPEPLTARLMRDMARNLERVVVNDLANYETLCRIQQEGRLSKETRVEYADERKTLLFDAFNLETAIDKALKKRVWLPCGGYLVFDFAEALTVLPFLFPAATPGLFVGCLITNLLSPYGLLDIVMGSLTTLLAAFLTSRCKNRWLAPLPPVVCNGILVGGMLAWEQVGFTGAFGVTFALNAASVALGELIACYGLGSLLLWRLPKMPFFKNRMK